MQYFIGIDIGTTSTKAIAIAASGTPLHETSQPYPSFQEAEGQHEQDAPTILEAVLNVLRQTRAAVPKTHVLHSIAFSAAMHSLLPVDKQGNALMHLLTWADTRSNDATAAFRATATARHIYQQTGTPVQPMAPLCKLIWLKQQNPTLFQQTHKFISIKEYVWFHLTGHFEIDHSIASATALFNNTTLTWSPEALAAASVTTAQLSTPVPVTHQRTQLTPTALSKLGWTNTPTLLTIGASDGTLANLGSGILHPGQASITVGTSGAVRVTGPHPTPDPHQRLFSYLLTDQLFVTGGATNNGGNTLQWLCENILHQPYSNITHLLDEAATIPPGARGLLFLPYLLGERAPIWNADARAAFIGLRSFHQQPHLVRAVMESVCFALADILQIVEETTGPIHTVYASGGITKNTAWLQTLADIINKPIVTNNAETSAMGAILLSQLASGLLAGLTQLPPPPQNTTTLQPNPIRHHLYQPFFTLYRSLYPQLKATFNTLNELSRLQQ